MRKRHDRLTRKTGTPGLGALLLSLVVALSSLFLASCPRAEEGSRTYFPWSISGVGTVAGGKVVLRDYSGEWFTPRYSGMGLPPGQGRVMGFPNGGLGVELGQTLRLYAPSGGLWVEIGEAAFPVPEGTEGIFPHGRDGLATLSKGVLDFHAFDPEGGWQVQGKKRLALPEGTEDAFSFGIDSLILRTGNELRIWSWLEEGGAWSKEAGDPLILPEGWKAAFGYHTNGVAVVMDRELRFFMSSGPGWTEVEEASLKIPFN